MTKPARIQIASFIILSGFLFSVFYHYWMGSYNTKIYPLSSFVGRDVDNISPEALDRRGIVPNITKVHLFGDLFLPYVITRDMNPYATNQTNRIPSSYPPFAHVVILPFTWFDYSTAVIIYIAGAFIGLLALQIYWLKSGDALGDALNIFIFTFLCYPFLFAIDRGNIEPYLLFMLAGFLICYRTKRLDLSAIFLSGAIAMKIFPGILLAAIVSDHLLKRNERFRFVVITASTVILLTVFSSLIWVGGIHQVAVGFLSGITNHNELYSQTSMGLPHGTSLYPLLRYARYMASEHPFTSSILLVPINNYKIFGMILLAFLTAVLFFPRIERWERIAILVLAAMLIPQVAIDYRSIWLFLPIWLFFNSPVTPRYGLCMTIIFAILLIPKSWVLIGYWEVMIGVLINPILIMIALAFIITRNILIWRDPGATPLPAKATA